MKTCEVAILGVAGAIGQEVIKILMEHNSPIRELHLLADARNTRKELTIADKEYIIEETTESSFNGMDIILGAVENDIAEKYPPIVAEKGAIVVDNSSAFRLDERVPLIIPEVNPQAVREHHGIIANPSCAVIIALIALQLLHAYIDVERMVVSTYQAVNGTDVNGIRELNQQVGALTHGKEIAVSTFRYQIAYNLIPQIGGFDEAGCSSEEMKIQDERRKTMSNPEPCVNCTCMRVPVVCSHSESIMVEPEKGIGVEKVEELLQGVPSAKLVDEPWKQVYPMPLDTADQDLVFVGRIREDMSGHVNALSFRYYGNQVHKGVTTNAIQVAKFVIQGKEKRQE